MASENRSCFALVSVVTLWSSRKNVTLFTPSDETCTVSEFRTFSATPRRAGEGRTQTASTTCVGTFVRSPAMSHSAATRALFASPPYTATHWYAAAFVGLMTGDS